MDVIYNESFLAVVEHGSFSAAARVLQRSQPSVSAHVAALERDVGATLFDRGFRPVRLTDAGMALLPHARALLHEVEAGRSSVAAIVGLQRGSVRLGSYPSASAAFLPAVLERFHSRHPGIDLQLLELGSIELEHAIDEGRIDLMLRPLTPRMTVQHVVHRVLWHEPLRAVLHPDHALAAQEAPLSIAELLANPIITTGRQRPESFDTHPFWARICVQPHIAFETTQPQTLISLVRAGHGVGVTNQLALQVSDTAGVRILPIDDDDARRDVAVHWVRDSLRSIAARMLLRATVETEVPDGVTVAEPPPPDWEP